MAACALPQNFAETRAVGSASPTCIETDLTQRGVVASEQI